MISGSASRFRERQCSVQILPGRCAALDGEPVGAGGHPEHQRIRRPRPGDTWLQKRKTGGRKNVMQAPDRGRPNREDESDNRTKELAGAGGATTIITNSVGDSWAGDV